MAKENYASIVWIGSTRYKGSEVAGVVEKRRAEMKARDKSRDSGNVESESAKVPRKKADK